MSAHVADFLARQFHHFTAQAGGEFDVDLLADDAPAQRVKTGGQQRHPKAPPVTDKFRMARFKLGHVMTQGQHPERRTVQIGHGGPAQPRFRMHPHPGMAGLDADFQHHRAIIGVQRLPNALALAFLLTARGSRA